MIDALIVENDPMVAQINKKYVESFSEFTVKKVCNSGEEALKIIYKEKIDIILLALHLPKLNGIDILKKLRYDKINIDVIIITGESEIEIFNECLKLGVMDYIIKPFEYERFKKALSKFKVRYELFSTKSKLTQRDIDKIINEDKFNKNEQCRKGINEITLKRIKELLEKYKKEYFTCEEIAEKTKLSRVTVRRYLEYIANIGELDRNIEYGEIGRPKTTYRIIE